MGVTSLWTVVQPCARPIKIDTLNKKRLAVDASIWIYQFLKAVRDKEGNALRNSHVVGFFQRICKLLFFGIKPVFVFDGGAPALKRQTISARKQRREGRREDALRTAGKLLALQMQRRAEEEEQKRKEEAAGHKQDDEEELPENLVYVDELHMTQQERQQNRKFRKKDAYHLPNLDVSLAEMGQPNDPRVMSLEELETYARQFDSGEDINVYDFSKIDFDSPFFVSLPASDRYNILNAARLRSRLRMGLSKEQLDKMFPDRMAFSRFQIERVRERNELTQRLMHLNGMTDDIMFGVNGSGRVAGEKGREYVLVKNDGVEGGWALGVIGDKDEGERNKPIDVDEVEKMAKAKAEPEEEEEEDYEEFEDVPIEGFNRLPKQAPITANNSIGIDGIVSSEEMLMRKTASNGPSRSEDTGSLFIADNAEDAVSMPQASGNLVGDGAYDEDEDLNRAIAMSLEKDNGNPDDENDDWREVFQQEKVQEINPFATNLQQSVSSIANKQSRLAAPNTSRADDSDEEEVDLQGALAKSYQTKRHTVTEGRMGKQPDQAGPQLKPQKAPNTGFAGPLPFEKLDLGNSLLGKKKMKKLEEANSGGFEKELDKPKKKTLDPIPPWFSEDVESGLAAQEVRQALYREQIRETEEQEKEFDFQPIAGLRKYDTTEVIDVDAPEVQKHEPVIIDSDDEGMSSHAVGIGHLDGSPLQKDDIANRLSAERPQGLEVVKDAPQIDDAATERNAETAVPEAETFEWDESDHEKDDLRGEQLEDVAQLVGGASLPARSRSSSLEFEDVDMTSGPSLDYVASQAAVEEAHVEDTTNEVMGMTNEEPINEDEDDDQDVYSDSEEDELMQQLAIEAEEHARFASSLNNKPQHQNIEEYERELRALRSQQKKDRRDADEVTHIMITECQQLLKLFGLPYITAPMEAEAQCAELVTLGLVDGIVTDDSDIFLFGGTRIYKNMFNQAKIVECYLSSDLEREFGLTRQKLISIAHLLGSDYTEGLPGVGPVTALEIISEFPDLQGFKDWWTRVQTGAKASDEDHASHFRRKFRKNTTKLFLPPVFPDLRVDAAYLEPEVDADPSAFQWGIPDLDALRQFLMATIGWGQERTDEVLVPVIRDMNRREHEGTQANITAFITGGAGSGTAFAPRRRNEAKSRRMETALERMAEQVRIARAQDRTNSAQVEEDAVIAVPGSAASPSKTAKAKSKLASKRTAAQSLEDTNYESQQSNEQLVKKTRKKRSMKR